MTREDFQRHLREGGQILKTRDDRAPIFFEREDGVEETAKPFRLSDNATCSWANADDTFGPKKLRPRIEPWLTALVQSEHLSLLLGSGLTHGIHAIAMADPLPGMSTIVFGVLNEEIENEAKRAAKLAGRDTVNFEDHVRAVNGLLRGLDIIVSTKETDAPERAQIKRLRQGLRDASRRSTISSAFF